MAEETEEEFKARMAAISSGYKKDRSERKVQLAEEGKALARAHEPEMTHSRADDPRYGIGGDMYGRGGYIGEPGMMARHMAHSLRHIMTMARERDYRRSESVDLDFLLGLADYLNHLEPSFPTERWLREALRYGLGRGGCDSVNIMDDPELYYTIGGPEIPMSHKPMPYKTVSQEGMRSAIQKIDEKYRGFRDYLNQLMGDFRHGRPLGDVHYQLQSFVMDRETRAMRDRAAAPKIVTMDLGSIEERILRILGSKEAVFKYLYGGMRGADEVHMVKMEKIPQTKAEKESVWIEDEIHEEKPVDKRAWMKFRDHSRNPKRR